MRSSPLDPSPSTRPILLSWIGVWCLAYFTLNGTSFLYIDESTARPLIWPFLLISLASFVIDDIRLGSSRILLPRILCLPVSLLGAWSAPDARARAIILLFAAGSLLPTVSRHRHAGSLRQAAQTLGILGIAFCLLRQLLPLVLARCADLAIPNAVVATLLRICGIQSGSSPNTLTVHGLTDAQFKASPELLALGPALVILSGASVLFCRHEFGKPVKHVALLLLTFAVFLLLRAGLLICLIADGQPLGLLYKSGPVLWSLLPLTALWMYLLRPRVSAPSPDAPHPSVIHALLLWCFLGISTLLLSVPHPGTRKTGRLLIDECHSEWERTDVPMTESQYGNLSTYNYYSMAQVLRYYYPVVDRNYRQLTLDTLRNYDVLILKTPTFLYGEAERSAILQFVADGGGLWLIGDHTDVFGTAQCLNYIAHPFGLTFNSDAVDSIAPHGRQVYHPRAFPPHPLTIHLPDSNLLATSCSLEIDGRGSAAIVGESLKADRARFRVYNFFGNVELESFERFGFFVQAATTTYGKGRVAAFTDSTVFSNFSFCFPGKWEFALSTISWLNRTQVNPSYTIIVLLSLLLLATLLAMVLRVSEVSRFLLSPETLICGVLIPFRIATAATGVCYPLPSPIARPVTVAFEMAHCDYLLPLVHPTHAWDTTNYETFFVWVQRTGLVPRIANSLDEALQYEAVILVRPRGKVSPDEIQRLAAYVRGGGRLLVLDEWEKDDSMANEILEPFGLSFSTKVMSSARLSLEGTRTTDIPSLEISSGMKVEGGTPFAWLGQVAIGASTTFGNGFVCALGIARSFSVDRFGLVRSQPDDLQRLLASIEYHALEEELGLRQDEPPGRSTDIR